MAKNLEKYSLVEICPIRNVVARFGNKWSFLLIMLLSENGTTRFNQLKKLIPDISTKVLSSTLSVLEADGLVSRTVYAEVPPRVEYALTPTGQSLVPLLLQLTEWAQSHMQSILKNRKDFEQSAGKAG